MASHPAPSGYDLLRYDWVMPPAESLLTQTVPAHPRDQGLQTPPQRLSTASFLLTLVLLKQSDAIAPMALAVANSFSRQPDGSYTILAVDLGIEVEPFGLITRRGAILTPSAARIAYGLQMLTHIDD